MWLPYILAILLLMDSVRTGEVPEKPHPEPHCRDTSISVFSATFYTAMVLTCPQEVFKLKLSSKAAYNLFYKIVLEELQKIECCNAEVVAKTFAHGAACLKIFNLPDYFFLQGYVMGEYLVKHGILNCNNAVELGLTYYSIVKAVLDQLNVTVIDSYVRAVTRGTFSWVQKLHHPLPYAAHELARLFHDEFCWK